jgi:FMN-dependent NADH-azoreductase
MSKLLHISASLRGDRSASITVARHFIDSYRAAHPGDTVETLDGAAIDAKYAVMHGEKPTPEETAAWARVTEIADQFKAADKYVFSLPMWNFGVPYKLKHWIDVVVQPGLTFGFSPETGYKGLVTGKRAAVIYARGGAYGPGSGMESYDLQSPYLKQVLGFIEPTESGPKEVAIEKAKKMATELAGAF